MQPVIAKSPRAFDSSIRGNQEIYLENVPPMSLSAALIATPCFPNVNDRYLGDGIMVFLQETSPLGSDDLSFEVMHFWMWYT